MASIIGVSGIISGLLSGVIYPYVSETRKSKREMKANLINDKLILYSVLLYSIDALLDIGQNAFPHDDSVQARVADILKTIDTALDGKFYLLKYDFLSKLFWIENAYQKRNHWPAERWNQRFSEDDNRTVEQELKNLRGLLVTEYNNIVREQRKVAGEGVPEISG